MLKFALLTIDR